MSTVIATGPQRPTNHVTGRVVEAAVRRGCAPATFAVFVGVIRIGLSGAQLTALARSNTTHSRPAENAQAEPMQHAGGSVPTDGCYYGRV